MLGAGMPFKMALICNLISASFIYLGVVSGLLLGEFGSNYWIYAIASGMFIYISVCDMVLFYINILITLNRYINLMFVKDARASRDGLGN